MRPQGPVILVVEDDRAHKEALADVILGEGWSFHEASTLEEALAAVHDLAPEVIVLEPRADGGRAAGLLVELRRQGGWVPVLLHSADPRFDAQYALEHGASAAVPRANGAPALRDGIARLLGETRTDRPR